MTWGFRGHLGTTLESKAQPLLSRGSGEDGAFSALLPLVHSLVLEIKAVKQWAWMSDPTLLLVHFPTARDFQPEGRALIYRRVFLISLVINYQVR